VDLIFSEVPYVSLTILTLIIIFRLFRFLPLLQEIRAFRLIYETMRRFVLPFYVLLICLYIIYYVFAIIGMNVFGGIVTTGSPQITDTSVPPLYYLNNFNDFGASIITLFGQMVVNNWFVTVGMYVDITGTKLTRLYFVLFFLLSVVVVLNIVVAFAIEMY